MGILSEWAAKNRANQPSLGGELKAMGREMVKDLRGTIHEAFFGQPEHAAEPGTPLNPTQQLVTADLKKEPQARDQSHEMEM